MVFILDLLLWVQPISAHIERNDHRVLQNGTVLERNAPTPELILDRVLARPRFSTECVAAPAVMIGASCHPADPHRVLLHRNEHGSRDRKTRRDDHNGFNGNSIENAALWPRSCYAALRQMVWRSARFFVSMLTC
jgi:hypothetical protein